jgi:hypothetical protein
MDKEFKNSVLQTLAYFDLFEKPLTAEELHRNLWNLERRVGYYDFLMDLQEMVENGSVETENGYYFFPGRSDLIQIREQRVRLVEKKMKIAKKGARLIRLIPFVRAIFVCNTLATETVNYESDVDLFIVIKKGRIWLTRFWIIWVLQLAGLRIGKRKTKNKICLSFYISEHNLDFSRISLSGDDIYLAYWINHLVPIYDPDRFTKEIVKQNIWLNNYLQHFRDFYRLDAKWMLSKPVRLDSIINFFEKIWGNVYGDILEVQARAIQLSKLKRNNVCSQEGCETGVVINDELLKFHQNDRRDEYRKKWQERCEDYAISE